jgi:hypothetical protein
MSALELKNKIIEQIDNMNDAEFGKVYHQLMDILESANHYQLSEEENIAIDSALKVSEEGAIYSHDQVADEARDKFPSLKFK